MSPVAGCPECAEMQSWLFVCLLLKGVQRTCERGTILHGCASVAESQFRLIVVQDGAPTTASTASSVSLAKVPFPITAAVPFHPLRIIYFSHFVFLMWTLCFSSLCY